MTPSQDSPFFEQQEHGGSRGDTSIRDFSVNLNSYGPPNDLVQTLRSVSFRDYPDPEARELRRQIASVYARDSEEVWIGNGANELLWAAARILLRAGETFTCLEPCYSEFSRAARAVGAEACPLRLAPELYASLSLERLLAHLDHHRSDVLYLCNPNSPSGAYLQPQLLKDLCELRPQLRIVLDESFLSLSHHHDAWRERYPDRVLRIVSLTKDFALAGLRLGYALAAPAWIIRLRAQIPNWSINTLALAAGSWCLAHPEFMQNVRPALLSDTAQLDLELRRRHLRPLPSATIFVMFEIEGAQLLAKRLLERHRILVRSCASYGFPTWWRIAARPANERQIFFHAFDQEYAHD